MRRLALLILGLLASGAAQAGLITHTDYNDGAVITASGQNTNENAIVNEINGNLDAANIEDGSIDTAELADNSVTSGKLAAVVRSTITAFTNYGYYRRPNLKFVSVTAVDVEANTSTANQTCVIFPDERRCVTENTGASSVNRRFTITETASNSGTKNSGLAAGEAEANNTWYALYAWKVSDNSTDFVVVGTTNTPNITNYARLNTLFGENAWLYLGMIHNGDGAAAAADIIAFTQTGGVTLFRNVGTGQNLSGPGYTLTASAGAVTLTYTYAAGTAAGQIPDHVGQAYFNAGGSGLTNQGYKFADSSGARLYLQVSSINPIQTAYWVPATEGVNISNTSSTSVTMDIRIAGYTDNVLSSGINPQL